MKNGQPNQISCPLRNQMDVFLEIISDNIFTFIPPPRFTLIQFNRILRYIKCFTSETHRHKMRRIRTCAIHAIEIRVLKGCVFRRNVGQVVR